MILKIINNKKRCPFSVKFCSIEYTLLLKGYANRLLIVCGHAEITDRKPVIVMDSYSTVIKILEKLHYDKIVQTSVRCQLPISGRLTDNCNIKAAKIIDTVICSNWQRG